MSAQKHPKEAGHTYPVPVSEVTTSGVVAPITGSPRDDEVLDQVDLAVIATDAEGVITTFNARAEALLGWSREDVIGRPARDVTVPESERAPAKEVLATLQRGETWQGLFPLRRRDGSSVMAFMKDSPILDGDGKLVGMVAVAIEVSDPALGKAVRALIGDGNHNSGRRTRALSPREREVLAFLARGLTGEQIAERLVLSPETVRTHIRNAREKLGASTRVEAVTMALLAREIQV